MVGSHSYLIPESLEELQGSPSWKPMAIRAALWSSLQQPHRFGFYLLQPPEACLTLQGAHVQWGQNRGRGLAVLLAP